MKNRNSGSKEDKTTKTGKFKIFLIAAMVVLAGVAIYIVLIQEFKPSNIYTPEKVIGDFKLVSDSVLLNNEKVVVLFVGAEACPYCVAESWSVVEALQYYGSFSGLVHILSNSSEAIPNVPGYGFANSSLDSSKVALWEVETTTSSWNQRLQLLNSTEQSLFKLYDPSGNIPFLLIGGLYVHIGSEVPPGPIANMNWTEAQKQTSSLSQIGVDVSREASNITTTINYVISNLSLFKGFGGSAVLLQNYSFFLQMNDEMSSK